MDGIKSCTCIAPVNIAVVKYWGKRDEHLILPVNSSVSVTLGLNELHAKTSIAASTKFTEDRLWLNGKEQSVDSQRIQNVLKEVRQKTGCTGMGDGTDVKVHICSENNFPTAAGLASSAAGYACMVYTLAKLYQVEGDLSLISRQGSGSACRSIYGGFVLWDMGERSDGLDSVARQIASPDHWPDLRILILVVSDQQKQVGSTEGMQTTVTTSELMQHRMQVVSQHVRDMIRAIQDRDFPTFAKITMQESNQFHAVCLDTYPPIFYLTDTSRQIIQLVHTYNKVHGETRVAYTFDAGPNACLYLMEKDVAPFLGLVSHFFPSNMYKDHTFIRGLPVTPASLSQSDLDQYPFSTRQGAVQYVIYTKVGAGPCELLAKDSLLDVEGLPRHLAG